MPLMLFGGLLVNPSTVFVWLAWIQYISPVRYCFEALCIAEWQSNANSRFIYEEYLGFGDKLSFWDCILSMLGISLSVKSTDFGLFEFQY